MNNKTTGTPLTSSHTKQGGNDYILMQCSLLKAGMKKFGEGGRRSTIKELQQMLTREVFGKTNQDKLTYK